MSLSAKSVSRTLAILALAGAVTLAGCARNRVTTGSVPSHLRKPVAEMNVSELRQATGFWAGEYRRRPKDKHTGLQFATALRMTGRSDQALAVMQQMAIHHPEDRQVLAAYGKAQAGVGDLDRALDTIRRAQRPDDPDWRLHSAQGAILDQQGKPKLARVQYRKALDLQPGEPSVLSNLGMSYLLTGDMRAAETYLRQAINRPGADSRVRQNLALVVGLQGRFAEAETIAKRELSPKQAEANLKYLRAMLGQRDDWKALDKKA